MEENRPTEVVNTTDGIEEAILVARARAGDKAAFGQLVKRFQAKLLRMVVAMTGSTDAAMDIVQDSFIRAWRALDGFEEGRPFYPWLSTIATNLTMNYFKKSGRETALDPVRDDRPDETGDPLQRLQLDENNRRFMKAVKELPEQYRVAFILRNFEELSYDEIAKRLAVSPGTVDSRLYRARRMLVDKLKDLLE